MSLTPEQLKKLSTLEQLAKEWIDNYNKYSLGKVYPDMQKQYAQVQEALRRAQQANKAAAAPVKGNAKTDTLVGPAKDRAAALWDNMSNLWNSSIKPNAVSIAPNVNLGALESSTNQLMKLGSSFLSVADKAGDEFKDKLATAQRWIDSGKQIVSTVSSIKSIDDIWLQLKKTWETGGLDGLLIKDGKTADLAISVAEKIITLGEIFIKMARLVSNATWQQRLNQAQAWLNKAKEILRIARLVRRAMEMWRNLALSWDKLKGNFTNGKPIAGQILKDAEAFITAADEFVKIGAELPSLADKVATVRGWLSIAKLALGVAGDLLAGVEDVKALWQMVSEMWKNFGKLFSSGKADDKLRQIAEQFVKAASKFIAAAEKAGGDAWKTQIAQAKAWVDQISKVLNIAADALGAAQQAADLWKKLEDLWKTAGASFQLGVLDDKLRSLADEFVKTANAFIDVASKIGGDKWKTQLEQARHWVGLASKFLNLAADGIEAAKEAELLWKEVENIWKTLGAAFKAGKLDDSLRDLAAQFTATANKFIAIAEKAAGDKWKTQLAQAKQWVDQVAKGINIAADVVEAAGDAVTLWKEVQSIWANLGSSFKEGKLDESLRNLATQFTATANKFVAAAEKIGGPAWQAPIAQAKQWIDQVAKGINIAADAVDAAGDAVALWKEVEAIWTNLGSSFKEGKLDESLRALAEKFTATANKFVAVAEKIGGDAWATHIARAKQWLDQVAKGINIAADAVDAANDAVALWKEVEAIWTNLGSSFKAGKLDESLRALAEKFTATANKFVAVAEKIGGDAWKTQVAQAKQWIDQVAKGINIAADAVDAANDAVALWKEVEAIWTNLGSSFKEGKLDESLRALAEKFTATANKFVAVAEKIGGDAWKNQVAQAKQWVDQVAKGINIAADAVNAANEAVALWNEIEKLWANLGPAFKAGKLDDAIRSVATQFSTTADKFIAVAQKIGGDAWAKQITQAQQWLSAVRLGLDMAADAVEAVKAAEALWKEVEGIWGELGKLFKAGKLDEAVRGLAEKFTAVANQFVDVAAKVPGEDWKAKITQARQYIDQVAKGINIAADAIDAANDAVALWKEVEKIWTNLGSSFKEGKLDESLRALATQFTGAANKFVAVAEKIGGDAWKTQVAQAKQWIDQVAKGINIAADAVDAANDAVALWKEVEKIWTNLGSSFKEGKLDESLRALATQFTAVANKFVGVAKQIGGDAWKDQIAKTEQWLDAVAKGINIAADAVEAAGDAVALWKEVEAIWTNLGSSFKEGKLDESLRALATKFTATANKFVGVAEKIGGDTWKNQIAKTKEWLDQVAKGINIAADAVEAANGAVELWKEVQGVWGQLGPAFKAGKLDEAVRSIAEKFAVTAEKFIAVAEKIGGEEWKQQVATARQWLDMVKKGINIAADAIEAAKQAQELWDSLKDLWSGLEPAFKAGQLDDKLREVAAKFEETANKFIGVAEKIAGNAWTSQIATARQWLDTAKKGLLALADVVEGAKMVQELWKEVETTIKNFGSLYNASQLGDKLKEIAQKLVDTGNKFIGAAEKIAGNQWATQLQTVREFVKKAQSVLEILGDVVDAAKEAQALWTKLRELWAGGKIIESIKAGKAAELADQFITTADKFIYIVEKHQVKALLPAVQQAKQWKDAIAVLLRGAASVMEGLMDFGNDIKNGDLLEAGRKIEQMWERLKNIESILPGGVDKAVWDKVHALQGQVDEWLSKAGQIKLVGDVTLADVKALIFNIKNIKTKVEVFLTDVKAFGQEVKDALNPFDAEKILNAYKKVENVWDQVKNATGLIPGTDLDEALIKRVQGIQTQIEEIINMIPKEVRGTLKYIIENGAKIQKEAKEFIKESKEMVQNLKDGKLDQVYDYLKKQVERLKSIDIPGVEWDNKLMANIENVKTSIEQFLGRALSFGGGNAASHQALGQELLGTVDAILQYVLINKKDLVDVELERQLQMNEDTDINIPGYVPVKKEDEPALINEMLGPWAEVATTQKQKLISVLETLNNEILRLGTEVDKAFQFALKTVEARDSEFGKSVEITLKNIQAQEKAFAMFDAIVSIAKKVLIAGVSALLASTGVGAPVAALLGGNIAGGITGLIGLASPSLASNGLVQMGAQMVATAFPKREPDIRTNIIPNLKQEVTKVFVDSLTGRYEQVKQALFKIQEVVRMTASYVGGMNSPEDMAFAQSKIAALVQQFKGARMEIQSKYIASPAQSMPTSAIATNARRYLYSLWLPTINNNGKYRLNLIKPVIEQMTKLNILQEANVSWDDSFWGGVSRWFGSLWNKLAPGETEKITKLVNWGIRERTKLSDYQNWSKA